jgi:hypothetical protein
LHRPIDARLLLFTETIPIGVTTKRMNAAKLAQPVTCTAMFVLPSRRGCQAQN